MSDDIKQSGDSREIDVDLVADGVMRGAPDGSEMLIRAVRGRGFLSLRFLFYYILILEVQ